MPVTLFLRLDSLDKLRENSIVAGKHPFNRTSGVPGMYPPVGNPRTSGFSYGTTALMMDPPTYTIERAVNMLHLARGLCTGALSFASNQWPLQSDHWALHPNDRLCTRMRGFAPDYRALHPTTAFALSYWTLQPNTKFCPKPNRAKTGQTNMPK